jgi:hypothetical protein
MVGMGHRRPATDFSTLPPEIYNAVMTLTPEERTDRATVNEAVRTQMSPSRPAGSADKYGVPDGGRERARWEGIKTARRTPGRITAALILVCKSYSGG